ncbi:MAG: hypothetical protein DRQ01_05300 [Ignavibacteriae bacterium]|nr:MAG: hypothetical protein DRQ01_05300 [Ignavibacteriota bacterium]
MKNTVTCPDCSSENPYYKLTCSNCNSYIRDKISNLDLWNITSKLIENPVNAFQKIIYSDHKNFIFFILFFVSIKFLINTRFLSLLTIGRFTTTTSLPVSFILILSFLVTYLVLFAFIFSRINSSSGFSTRFKDIFSIVSYSQLPHVFGLVVLFPIELIIFGDYIFSLNPSPFVIKETIAYTLLTVESLLILWSVFLSITAFYTHFRKVIPALVSALILNGLLVLLMYFSSRYIFTI